MSTKAEIYIDHPELWNMGLHITSNKIKYLLVNTSAENSLTTGEFDIAGNSDSTLKAIETVIYDHQLLGDFNDVRIVVDSQHFVVLPPTSNPTTISEPTGKAAHKRPWRRLSATWRATLDIADLQSAMPPLHSRCPKG